MTQDEIIDMAKQAGITNYRDFRLESFARRIHHFAIAKEREACAKTVEQCVWPRSAEHPYDTRGVFADAIRARGEA